MGFIKGGEVCFQRDFSGFPKDSSETSEAKAAPRSLGGAPLGGRKPTIPMVTWDPRMESLGDDPPSRKLPKQKTIT